MTYFIRHYVFKIHPCGNIGQNSLFFFLRLNTIPFVYMFFVYSATGRRLGGLQPSAAENKAAVTRVYKYPSEPLLAIILGLHGFLCQWENEVTLLQGWVSQCFHIMAYLQNVCLAP